MSLWPEERDKPYEIAEEMEEKETDAKETDVHTIPPVTSNDLRALPPSARR